MVRSEDRDSVSRRKSPASRRGRSDRDKDKEKDKDKDKSSGRSKDSKESRKRSRKRSPDADKKDSKKGRKDKDEPKQDTAESSEGGTWKESLSVEDTNALRIKLGLAPLDAPGDAQPNGSESQGDDTAALEGQAVDTGGVYRKDRETGRIFVHKAPDSWTERNEQQKIRDKLEVSRLKREATEKLSTAPRLGENDKGESAAQFVERLRNLDKEREMAEARERELAAVDDELGVSGAIEAQLESDRRAKRTKAAKAAGVKKGVKKSALAGFTVEHSKEDFLQGEEAILVLKDKDVLDESEGERLLDVRLADETQWKHNADMRSKYVGRIRNMPDLNDDEMDEYGQPKEKGLLEKYDADFERSNKAVFQLDEAGGAELTEEKIKAHMKAELLARQMALDDTKYTPATEYYTTEEMLAFKKSKNPKKERNTRKRTKNKLKADDLLNDAPIDGPDSADYGSRSRGKGKNRPDYELLDKHEPETTNGNEKNANDPKTAVAKLAAKLRSEAEKSDDDSDDSDAWQNSDDVKHAALDDEDDALNELNAALGRARKVAELEKEDKMAKISTMLSSDMAGHSSDAETRVKQEPDDPEADPVAAMDSDDDDGNRRIVLDATLEYAKGLGRSGRAGDDLLEAKSEADDDMDVKRHGMLSDNEDEEIARVERRKHRKERVGGWATAEPQADKKGAKSEPGEAADQVNSDEEEELFSAEIGGESGFSQGVAGALRQAKAKGFLEKNDDEDDPMGGTFMSLACKRKSTIDNKWDIDDKYAKKLDKLNSRTAGPTRPFEEKREYAPSFHLTYTDQNGEHLNTKEAWRRICWKFHGRFPSKKQVETKVRRAMQEERVRTAGTDDTPLRTLDKLVARQKATSQPYVMLSGTADRNQLTMSKE